MTLLSELKDSTIQAKSDLVLRLDYITRMLVNLDVADDIVNAMSSLHDTVVAIEARISGPAKSYWTPRACTGLSTLSI